MAEADYKKRLTVPLTEELYKKLKFLTIDLDVTMGTFIREAVQEKIDRIEAEKKGDRNGGQESAD